MCLITFLCWSSDRHEALNMTSLCSTDTVLGGWRGGLMWSKVLKLIAGTPVDRLDHTHTHPTEKSAYERHHM